MVAALSIACGKETPPEDPNAVGSTSESGIDLTGGDNQDDPLDPEYETSGGTVNPEGGTSGCGEVQVTVVQETPTLVLLVDQSGSMTSDFNGVDRWDALYETLMDPDDGVVVELESKIRFGLTLYTSENGFEGGECPQLSSVGPSLNNFGAIDQTFEPANPVDETPTGESLAAVAEELALFDEPGPKGIVLATDGEPDTCAEPNPQNGQPEAIAAGVRAFDLGIKTFVLSVGDEVGENHLQEMANVGVGKAPDDPNPAPFYKALNPQELVDAFDQIVGSFVSCTFTIDGLVDLDQVCDGKVWLDGEQLECGTDWDVIDMSTLELKGEACERLKDGQEHQVQATWPCGAIDIPG